MLSLELLIPGLIVGFLAAVQSVFGMGILVFGTPTFLLMGYSFTETLGFLLPASLAVSCVQVFVHKSRPLPISRSVWAFCLPAIAISLFLAISSDWVRNLYVLIAMALLLSAAARLSSRFHDILRAIIQKNLKLYHVAMGTLHGMTNMGGAMLGVMVAAIYKDKNDARYVIAFYYLMFVTIQCVVLIFSGVHDELLAGAHYAPVSLLVFLLVGNKVFTRLNNEKFQVGLTVFLVLYAVTLLLKWAGLF